MNFVLSCAARLLARERAHDRARREEAWERARATAQMTAAMMWCKHDAAEREKTEGGTRCGACGARFRGMQNTPQATPAAGPFKAQTVKVRRGE